MISNFEIEYLLQHETSFLGCFHVNQLPPFPSYFPSSLIIFTEKHWVALLLLNKKKCFYFDSEGKKINDLILIQYLKPTYNKITYNCMKIQHEKSKKCGEFCLVFVPFCGVEFQFISDQFLRKMTILCKKRLGYTGN